MPLYDYTSACGQRFEMLLRHDAPPPPCPCGSTDCATARAPSAPGGFTLKGEGFYKPSRSGG